jgi:hypothetical protein
VVVASGGSRLRIVLFKIFYFTARMSGAGGLKLEDCLADGELGFEGGIVTIVQHEKLPPWCVLKVYDDSSPNTINIKLGVLAESSDTRGRYPPTPELTKLWTDEQTKGLPQLVSNVLEHPRYKGKIVKVSDGAFPVKTKYSHYSDGDNSHDPENIFFPLQEKIFGEVITSIRQTGFKKIQRDEVIKDRCFPKTHYVYEPRASLQEKARPQASLQDKAKGKALAIRKLFLLIYSFDRYLMRLSLFHNPFMQWRLVTLRLIKLKRSPMRLKRRRNLQLHR